MSDDTTHRVTESADKITLTTKVKRGEGTRDQDTVKVKVKGDDPAATAQKLAETLIALESRDVTNTLRETQPGEGSGLDHQGPTDDNGDPVLRSDDA